MQRYKENKGFSKAGRNLFKNMQNTAIYLFCRSTVLQFNYKTLVKKNACLERWATEYLAAPRLWEVDLVLKH